MTLHCPLHPVPGTADAERLGVRHADRVRDRPTCLLSHDACLP